MGIVIMPVVATLADALPDSEPNSALATTLTLAGPPRRRPRTAKPRSEIDLPAPTAKSIWPNIMKAVTIVAATKSGAP